VTEIDAETIKNKTIKSIFFCGIFVLLVIIINVVFPKKEITIEERLSYLFNEYYKEKGKYDCTPFKPGETAVEIRFKND